MDLVLDPPYGVGPLRIGMARAEANAALEQLRDADAVSASDVPGRHVIRPSGLVVSIGCMHERLQVVELHRPETGADTVRFRGIDVFSLPARQLIEQLREEIEIRQDDDDPASYCASELVLSLWRPFAADDEPDEAQGYYFSTVLVAAPGYYDTPAQAAERARREDQSAGESTS
jgi:hypothetical protein